MTQPHPTQQDWREKLRSVGYHDEDIRWFEKVIVAELEKQREQLAEEIELLGKITPDAFKYIDNAAEWREGWNDAISEVLAHLTPKEQPQNHE